MASLLASPLLGALLSVSAAYGFWLIARGFETWGRRYALVAAASRGAALVATVLPLGVASLLPASEPHVDTWGVRLVLYVMWSGLWIAYYATLMDRLDDLGASAPVTTTALGANILLSPVLTEAFPAQPDVKLALALSLYAGYMPPLNVSALLAALAARLNY
jgi:hypothetical protein